MGERLAAAPTKTLGLVKSMLNVQMNSSLEDMLNLEAEMQEIAGTSGRLYDRTGCL